MANDYKKTMNLPQTSFSMKANLAQNEPKRLKVWEDENIYELVLKANEGHESYVLHDGPPYANGAIHIGHAFNKTLKDFVVKYKSQRGYYAPYTPGWDCHGQPIEHNVEEQLGPEKMKKIDQVTLRRICREYAQKYIGIQREGFKRLGVRGDWNNPYLTYTNDYEADDVVVFKKMYEKGMIYRGRKPIHWCMHCHTALAEAEIEYADEESPSIYVKFDLIDVPEQFAASGVPVKLLIWTTTPWTLPANVAVALKPDASYVAVLTGGEALVMAEALVPEVAEIAGWGEDPQLLHDASGEVVRMTGDELCGLAYHRPIFPENAGTVIVGDHVTLDTGTGAVHTAPGHGEDDYIVGQKFGLPTLMPVDDDGCFTEQGGPWAGMNVWDANPKIIDWLEEKGSLLAMKKITHSYPHCWRCRKPVIFRATDQWFVSMDKTGLREQALKAIDGVNWVPGWSVNRIRAMIEDRPDWCISRQRSWGVPIPVFKCKHCDATVATPETFDAVIALFREKGADAWFAEKPEDYLPEGTCCPECGCTELVPEKDILDVWWDSGVSHTAVLEEFPRLHRPAEMYLEGSDQHRGWFQSSLLTSVGAYGIAPYKNVFSCGFIVDGEGRKMSKSLGNGVDPAEVTNTVGADVLRLWVCAADVSQDVSVSDEILTRTSEAYRKIRNTFRFLLSNLYDFDDSCDMVSWDEMPSIDKWAMARLEKLLADVTESWDAYQFHAAYRELYEYTTELSNVYLDMLKDRLYSDGAKSVARRSAQTVLCNILEVLVRVWGPVLTFTVDEIWENCPEPMLKNRDPQIVSVQLAGWPEASDFVPAVPSGQAEKILANYEAVFAARDVATKAIEEKRGAGEISKSQEAAIVLVAPADIKAVLDECGGEALAELFIVSSVVIEEGEELSARVEKAHGERCPRCWNYRETGADRDHPDLCERCAEVVSSLEDAR